ncbi:MAG: flotillin family protein, partial [Planctomycetota bacterium]|nr:flotillin family protein [Planctomycetota bacterium]
GSSTANFVSSLIKTLPPLHDIASMAGVELPEYLGRIAEKSVSKTEEDGNDGGGRRRAQTSKQKPQS